MDPSGQAEAKPPSPGPGQEEPEAVTYGPDGVHYHFKVEICVTQVRREVDVQAIADLVIERLDKRLRR